MGLCLGKSCRSLVNASCRVSLGVSEASVNSDFRFNSCGIRFGLVCQTAEFRFFEQCRRSKSYSAFP